MRNPQNALERPWCTTSPHYPDPVYKVRGAILDRGRWCAVGTDAILAQAMADRRDQNGRPGGRARPNDQMMQEVRWRLFRREDMPARLRRLERLEETALSEQRAPPPADNGGETGR